MTIQLLRKSIRISALSAILGLFAALGGTHCFAGNNKSSSPPTRSEGRPAPAPRPASRPAARPAGNFGGSANREPAAANRAEHPAESFAAERSSGFRTPVSRPGNEHITSNGSTVHTRPDGRVSDFHDARRGMDVHKG